MVDLPPGDTEARFEGALPALRVDLAELGELRRQAMASLAAARGGPLLLAEGQGIGAGDGDLAELLEDRACRVLAGWYEGALVGIAVVRLAGPDGGNPYVRNLDARGSELMGIVTVLYVEPEARGVGVGESLLTAAVAWCEDRRCSGVDVAALPGDRGTKALLERLGFTARKVVMHRAIQA